MLARMDMCGSFRTGCRFPTCPGIPLVDCALGSGFATIEPNFAAKRLLNRQFRHNPVRALTVKPDGHRRAPGRMEKLVGLASQPPCRLAGDLVVTNPAVAILRGKPTETSAQRHVGYAGRPGDQIGMGRGQTTVPPKAPWSGAAVLPKHQLQAARAMDLVLSSQRMFSNAVPHERDLRLDFWSESCPRWRASPPLPLVR